MDEIDEVIKKQIRNEPIQITEQNKENTFTEHIINSFLSKDRIIFLLPLHGFPNMQSQLNKSRKEHLYPTQNVCFLSEVTSCPSDLTSVHYSALLSSPEWKSNGKARKENVHFT